jgi:hypothetical protein
VHSPILLIKPFELNKYNLPEKPEKLYLAAKNAAF